MKKLIYFPFVFALAILLPANLYAQLTAKMTNQGVGYLEYLPPDYATNPTKRYPLMLFLHGAGEKGSGTPTDLEKVKRNGPPKEIVNGHNMCFEVNGKTECFIVIAPQLEGSKPSWGVSYIDGVYKYVFNNYRVDMNRVYLTGLSLGGNGVYKYAYLSVNDPNKLAAMSPIAAWGDTNYGCTISERKIPVWAFHGDQDKTVGYASGLAMFNSIKDCTTPVPTAELIFTTYVGVGHNSWGRAYMTDHSLHNPNLYEWLLSKSLAGNPTANAGPDKEITLPTNSVVLSGSGSDPGGSIVSYSWTRVSGPTAILTNAATPTLTASNLLEGVYTFQLTVTDNDGNKATDLVNVTVNPEVGNAAPVANAGADIQLVLPTNSTNIVGVASDPDGTIANVSWTQQSGPSTATLAGATSSTVTVSNLLEGIYIFRFTVTDNDGASAFDQISVEVINNVVNTAPVAEAGNSFSLKLPTNTTNITGTGSDSDGSIVSYLWEKVNGPSSITITNANTATVTISALVEGVYTMQLTVTDNQGATGKDQMSVAVLAANKNPVANAGNDITLTLPTNSTNITGSGSDSDGSIQSYSWAQTTGPSTATLSNNNKAQMTASALIEGIYTFQLTVTDNNGASDTDDVKVTVNSAPVNVPPVANAGSDKNITLPVNSVVLSGSGSDTDGTIATYAWSKVSGPATFSLSGQTTNQLTASNLVAGTYEFKLVVTDNSGATASDNVLVNVAPETVNQTPVANAGPNKNITLPTNQVVFNGSGSDADGTITSYSWTQQSGPSTATLSGQTSANLTASALQEGTYTFQLEVMDDDGASGTDQVNVMVSAANIPPVVSAGNDINLTLPTNSVNIVGAASDADGTIASASWSQISGTAASFTVSNTTISITNLTAGTYVFEFSATDNSGASSADQVTVTVTLSNVLPTVNAGPNQSITLPTNSINLTGSASDSDGTIASYAWSMKSGPSAASLANATTTTLTASNLIEGIYVFTLSVTDNDGGTAADDVQVTVIAETINMPPTANAGPNISIMLPTSTANLNGSGTDMDGSIVSYSWTKLNGPSVTLSNNTSATVTLTNLVEGTYTFRLTVTDDDGDKGTDDVTVTVSPAIVNQSPTANAGNDITITLPINSSNLTGSGSDADGTVTTYNWQQVSGPSSATLTNPTLATATVSDLVEGNYTFLLTVTDDEGAQDDDEMVLTVLPELVNQQPLADAGADQTVQLPTNTVNLAGIGSDPDGSIVAYLWVKTSGPAATLTNANTPTLTLTGLVEGDYTFSLTVTDDGGETGSDEVNVRVLAERINQSPLVSAGSDIELVLPENSTDLIGAASDDGGSIISTSWTQISGPSTATLSNADQLVATASNLIEGNYIFRFSATDNEGAQGSDEKMVVVLPDNTNVPPVANAGNDLELFLPENTIELIGSGADSDGTITDYFWEKISGPTYTIDNPNSSTIVLSNLLEGTYQMVLTVTDDDGATGTDEMTLKVFAETANEGPIVSAGEDIFLQLPDNSTSITGEATDPDGTITAMEWSVISGPNSPGLAGADGANVTLSNLIEGTYEVQFRAEDNGGLSNSDIVNVFVEPEGADILPAPEVDAGPDQTIQLPQSSAQLIGEVISGGLINSYLWTQLSGPAIDLMGIDNDTLQLTNILSGDYIFRFTATDNEGLSGSDEVNITVLASDNPISDDPDYPQRLFSPNGDGMNDDWILNPDLNAISTCELKIFDKRGVEIYSAKPYLNDWDGTFDGKRLHQGVYYYVVRCDGLEEDITGSITIIK